MRYRIKLYPDIISKEGVRIIELEADDVEVESLSDNDSNSETHIYFMKKTGKGDGEAVAIYGTEFSKVIEYYAISAIISIDETSTKRSSNTAKFKLLEFPKKETK